MESYYIQLASQLDIREIEMLSLLSLKIDILLITSLLLVQHLPLRSFKKLDFLL